MMNSNSTNTSKQRRRQRGIRKRDSLAKTRNRPPKVLPNSNSTTPMINEQSVDTLKTPSHRGHSSFNNLSNNDPKRSDLLSKIRKLYANLDREPDLAGSKQVNVSVSSIQCWE